MNVLIRCVRCQRPLRIPEEILGAEIRCPRCQATLAAPEVGLSAEEPVQRLLPNPSAARAKDIRAKHAAANGKK